MRSFEASQTQTNNLNNSNILATNLNTPKDVKSIEIGINNDITSKTILNRGKINNRRNLGFDKLKNTTLRNELQKCNSINYDVNKHVRIKDLGFKTIYELDKRSNKMWIEYFSKNEVYLDRSINSSKLTQRILFDNTIKDYLTSKDTKSQKGSDSNSF